jgi:hypothetical protein
VDDVRDPLFGSGLHREAVVCTRCGDAWDDRLVTGAATEVPGTSLCPACLLTTTHGDPFPDDPTDTGSRTARETRDA